MSSGLKEAKATSMKKWSRVIDELTKATKGERIRGARLQRALSMTGTDNCPFCARAIEIAKKWKPGCPTEDLGFCEFCDLNKQVDHCYRLGYGLFLISLEKALAAHEPTLRKTYLKLAISSALLLLQAIDTVKVSNSVQVKQPRGNHDTEASGAPSV